MSSKAAMMTSSPQTTLREHIQEFTTSLATMDSVINPNAFPFFQLPPEIRNMIYRLVVITERSLVVRDMHCWEFKENQGIGAYRSRSTYLAPDHICNLDTKPHTPLHSCLQKDARFGPLRTTYTLGIPQTINQTTAVMLSLDKRSRQETASLFYGANTFQFTAMSSLMPFMKDRTPETRRYIERLWLTLVADERNWDTIFAEQGRPAVWNKAFASLLKLPQTNIKKLCIEIADAGVRVNLDGPTLRTRSMLWLHKLRRFENLQMLGLKYTLGEWKYSGQFPDLRGDFSPTIEDTNCGTEQELWDFLAPNMLKKEGDDDHSPDALQRRRIRDFIEHRYLTTPPESIILLVTLPYC